MNIESILSSDLGHLVKFMLSDLLVALNKSLICSDIGFQGKKVFNFDTTLYLYTGFILGYTGKFAIQAKLGKIQGHFKDF